MCDYNDENFRNEIINGLPDLNIGPNADRIFHGFINNDDWHIRFDARNGVNMNFAFAIHRGFVFDLPWEHDLNHERFGLRIRVRVDGNHPDLRQDLINYMNHEFLDWPQYNFNEDGTDFNLIDFVNYFDQVDNRDEFNPLLNDVNANAVQIVTAFQQFLVDH